MNRQLGVTFGELDGQTAARLALLRKKHPIVVVRECEIKAQLKTDPEMADFFAKTMVSFFLFVNTQKKKIDTDAASTQTSTTGFSNEKKNFLTTSLKGGRTENLATIVKSTEKERLVYYDFTSL